MGIDFLIPMALSVVFAVLKSVVKNPAHKAQMESAFTKLRDGLNAAYPPAFTSPVGSSLLSAVDSAAVPQESAAGGAAPHGVSNVENGW